jgi:hypothetical protein
MTVVVCNQDEKKRLKKAEQNNKELEKTKNGKKHVL